MEGFLQNVRTRAKDAKEFVAGVAFDVKSEWDEFVHTGMGVPKAVSQAVSLGCFAIAAAGTASVSFDLVGKVYGARECKRCNGWEGLTCQTCKGMGKVPFRVKNPNLRPDEENTAENVAASVVEGRAEVAHVPFGLTVGAGLPTKQCPTCDGSGVMKCPECKGNAWKDKLSFDNIFDASWKAWDVYRLATPVRPAPTAIQNPDLAKFFMFVRPELEGGVAVPEETKRRMWWQYEHSQQYNQLRAEVAKRGPGWEEKQKALVELNPNVAMQDPVVVPNISLFKATKETEGEVLKLPVPPRPANWGNIPDILEAPDWSTVSDPEEKTKWEDALQKQNEIKAAILDKAWAQEWRQTKVGEVLKEKAIKIEQGASAEPAARPQTSTGATAEGGAKGEAGTTKGAAGKGKATEKKKVDKKALEEERKKKEKEEKRARMAKQAAEREAALAAAKKGKGTSS